LKPFLVKFFLKQLIENFLLYFFAGGYCAELSGEALQQNFTQKRKWQRESEERDVNQMGFHFTVLKKTLPDGPFSG
jgi:hypothetical protein